MKFITQFGIILAISFIGEILNRTIPLPIPASIYGMTILFTALCTGVIKLSAVKETGKLLITMMPLMFIPPAVGLIESWDVMQECQKWLVPRLWNTIIKRLWSYL